MFDTTLFNVSLPEVSICSKKTLVLSGCRVNLNHDRTYSEFEELNIYSLNCNNYGCGKAEIELFFDNSFPNPYFAFYMQCITIRTDTGFVCKINKNPIPDNILGKRYSKVTKDGKVSFGLGYYFRSNEELVALSSGAAFCVEGFVAIGKKTNVYGFVCQMKKEDGKWQLTDGNTYRIYKNAHIRGLVH